MIATTVCAVLQINGKVIISQVLAVVRPHDNLLFVAQRIVDTALLGAVVLDAWILGVN